MKRHNIKIITIIFIIVMIFSSCAVKPKFIREDYQKLKPSKVAVLPVINQTADVEGGKVFRNLVHTQLAKKGYPFSILKKKEMEEKLNEEGITDGGQLKVVEKNELCNILGTDGLLFIQLLECDYSSYAIASTKKIKAHFGLFKGEVLIWEDIKKVNDGKSVLTGVLQVANGNTDELVEDFAKQVAVKAASGWMMDHELKPQMIKVINRSFRTLPK